MSILLISIITFGIAIVCIALLYVTLSVTRKENPIWRNCLFACMVFMGAGSIMIFVPSLSIYAALTGITGVLIMVSGVTYVRWNASRGIIVETVPRRIYAIRASIFVLIAGIVAAPFFVVFSNQQEVKVLQYGIFGQLRRLETKIDEAVNVVTDLIRIIQQSRQERREQVTRDSLRSIKILENQAQTNKSVDAVKKQTGVIERQNRKASNRTDRQDRINTNISPIQLPDGSKNLLLSPTRVHPYYRLAKPKTK